MEGHQEAAGVLPAAVAHQMVAQSSPSSGSRRHLTAVWLISGCLAVKRRCQKNRSKEHVEAQIGPQHVIAQPTTTLSCMRSVCLVRLTRSAIIHLTCSTVIPQACQRYVPSESSMYCPRKPEAINRNSEFVTQHPQLVCLASMTKVLPKGQLPLIAGQDLALLSMAVVLALPVCLAGHGAEETHYIGSTPPPATAQQLKDFCRWLFACSKVLHLAAAENFVHVCHFSDTAWEVQIQLQIPKSKRWQSQSALKAALPAVVVQDLHVWRNCTRKPEAINRKSLVPQANRGRSEGIPCHGIPQLLTLSV